METAIASGAALAITSAWWRWRNADMETMAEALALRLMAYAAGRRAQKAAREEAMRKEIVLR